jgi:ABC-type phosphate transport system permease subunit
MSLNFDVNSNPSLVRSFHTTEKLGKCVSFILTVCVFFATNCTVLFIYFILMHMQPAIQKSKIQMRMHRIQHLDKAESSVAVLLCVYVFCIH